MLLRKLSVSLLVLAALAGCQKKDPPPKIIYVERKDCKDQQGSPASQLAAAPCVDLEERCAATKETWLPIKDTDYEYQPPEGWLFAGEAEQALTQTTTGEAMLAVTRIDNAENKTVLATTERLFKRLDVHRVAEQWLGNRLHTPDHVLTANSLKVNLWEIGERQQFSKSPKLNGKTEGTALVFVAPLESGGLLGAAFASVNEVEAAPRIMAAVQTIRKKTE
jgi:hypothetical protein